MELIGDIAHDLRQLSRRSRPRCWCARSAIRMPCRRGGEARRRRGNLAASGAASDVAASADRQGPRRVPRRLGEDRPVDPGKRVAASRQHRSARRRAPTARRAAPRTAAAQVVDYLRAIRISCSAMPSCSTRRRRRPARRGAGVLDMQQFMVERLRRDWRGCAPTGRPARQQPRQPDDPGARRIARRWRCSGRSFENLIEIVVTDLAVVLDVDIVSLGVEAATGRCAALGRGRAAAARGTVTALLGNGRERAAARRRRGRSGDLRRAPPAWSAPMPCCGCRRARRRRRAARLRHAPPRLFQPRPGHRAARLPGAAVLEHCIRQWLDLPA